jgi:membrane protein DedA with SNARE-associated domain
MNETLHFLAKHGYWLLVVAVLGRQACLPVAANALLVAAGALARSGRLSLPVVVCISVVTFLLADLAWYEAGRRKGERVLHFLRLSNRPESWVHRATSAFASRGVRTLLFSKFVVGLDAIAVPLTGATHVAPVQFLVFDALGAMFWSASYVALGYIFSNQLDRVAVYLARIGTFVAIAVAAGFGFYLVRRLARWRHSLRRFQLARITPEQLKKKLNAGKDILVVDLRGRLDPATGVLAIPDAVRIEPRRLEGAERKQILAALKQTNWIVAGPKGAAALLGMKRSTLQAHMQRLGSRVSRAAG